MRRSMFLLSLIAALSATPLRLAEAAADQARDRAEPGVVGGVEAPDGGVGDDSDATIRAERAAVPPTSSFACETLADPFLPVFRALSPDPGRPASPPPQTATAQRRRLARLQRFLC